MDVVATFRRGIAIAIRFARRKRRASSECGATIIETAFALLILLTFLFGVMEVCLMLYSYHFISEAARAGTRYAIVRGSSCVIPTDFASACPASTLDIQNYVKNLGFPGINPGNMTVAVTNDSFPVSGRTCTPSASCNNPSDLVKVVVTYNFPLTIPFVPKISYAMSSTSAMVISQ